MGFELAATLANKSLCGCETGAAGISTWYKSLTVEGM
jgi:hypothetical protein